MNFICFAAGHIPCDPVNEDVHPVFGPIVKCHGAMQEVLPIEIANTDCTVDVITSQTLPQGAGLDDIKNEIRPNPAVPQADDLARRQSGEKHVVTLDPGDLGTEQHIAITVLQQKDGE